MNGLHVIMRLSASHVQLVASLSYVNTKWWFEWSHVTHTRITCAAHLSLSLSLSHTTHHTHTRTHAHTHFLSHRRLYLHSPTNKILTSLRMVSGLSVNHVGSGEDEGDSVPALRAWLALLAAAFTCSAPVPSADRHQPSDVSWVHVIWCKYVYSTRGHSQQGVGSACVQLANLSWLWQQR